MKIVGTILVALALVIGIVPQFTDCHSQGKLLTLTSGKTVDMKCHWTAMAAIATAIPLGGLGILLALSKQKETRRMLTGLTALLGAVTILLPTYLIGVCANNAMLCNSVMSPTLILSGSLVILTSLIALFNPIRAGGSSNDLHPIGV